MNKINIFKILIILLIIPLLLSCSLIKIVSNNKTQIGEINIGNAKSMFVNNEDIYYIDTSDKHKLYLIDNQFKYKKLILNKYITEIVGVLDKEIYFIQKTMEDETTPLFSLCSADISGDFFKLIVKDVGTAILLNNKLYYYKETDEEYEENMGYRYRNFCIFDLSSYEETIMDKKTTATGIVPVLYKDKIYYEGIDDKFLEYNPNTREKRELNKGLLFCRYSDDNIYSYKENSIKKSSIINANTEILLKSDEIYNIWDMNVSNDYIFFLAQDTKEVMSDNINRLNVYRMKKDGSEIKKIYFSDYTENITYPKHHIYNLGDKLLLYERNEKVYLSNRNRFQLIDYNGKEIDSSILNN